VRPSFHIPATIVCLIAALAVDAHVRTTTQPGGPPLVRTDVTNIEYVINDQTAAGMMNADGQAIISADSDPIAALRSSVATWNAIPTSAIHFAALQTSDLTDNGDDGRHVFIFTDTPEHRTRTAGALAITSNFFDPDTGELTDSDIIFNPVEKFSTTLTADTFDLRTTLTHELGHALGADHTIFFGATMYQSGPKANDLQAVLTTDDIAFANDAYPSQGQAGGFGSLTGTVTTTGGQGVPGASVTAIDLNNYTHLSGLTEMVVPDANPFTYTLKAVPPGTYLVYAEPLSGPVFPGNVGLPSNLVDTGFHTTAVGSFANPTTVVVTAGGASTLDVTVEPGPSALEIDIFGGGSAGGEGDAGYGRGFERLRPGEARDLMVWGIGIDGTITENDIHILADGVTLRPGTLRIDPFVNVNGRDPIRFTVDVAPNAPDGLGSVVIAKNGDAAAWSGGLIIRGVTNVVNPVFTAAGLVNAANFTAGDVSPDSWVDLFGENFGSGSLVLDPSFPTTLDGVTVTVTDSQGTAHTARIHFVTGGRIQFIMPPNMANGPATLRVGNSSGGAATAAINIASVSPGIFSANANGKDAAAATFLLVRANSSRETGFTFTVDPPPARANIPVSLGAAGDQLFISFFGTAFRNQTSVSCRIDGIDVPVFGATAQGQFDALDQAVVGPIPAALRGRRNVVVEFLFNGVAANTVTISFE
jgi:uncharacterized protein (TIGR03437 family)